MTERTQLLGQGKKKKAGKRDSMSLKKVRDFVARYSNDTNESPLFDSEKGSLSLGKASMKSPTVLDTELKSQDTPFVAGQGGAFKILDEDAPDFQTSSLEEEGAAAEQTAAFMMDEDAFKSEEPPMRSAPFVAGQGGAFKILDEDAPDFQTSSLEEEGAAAEQTAAFKLTDNEFSSSFSDKECETERPLSLMPVAKEQGEENEPPSDMTMLDSPSWKSSSPFSGESMPDFGELPLPLQIEEKGQKDMETSGNAEPYPDERGQLLPSVEQDREAHLHPCLVSFLEPDSFAAEQYRALGSSIERLKEEEKGSSYVVAVTSPSDGDGKTTTAINLAGAFAQNSGVRVLLVDAELSSPAILKRLGVDSTVSKGLVEALKSPRIKLKNITVQCPQLNLTVLPAGRTTASVEALATPRLASLLGEARREYDYIVIDMPSVTSFPDCRKVEDYLDGLFVVVAAHKTPRKLVHEALSVLSERKNLGLIFNRGKMLKREEGDDSSCQENETEELGGGEGIL